MKQYVKYIVLAAVLIAVIAAAALGYNYLSNRYQPDSGAVLTTSSKATEGTAATSTAVTLPETEPQKPTTEESAAEESAAEETTTSPALINTAPDFTVTDKNGKKVSLSDYFGKPIIINFWASWCGSCRSELSSFDALSAEYNGDAVFMMVNLTDGYRDTVSGIKNFVADSGYTFPVYFDTSHNASGAYSVSGIPVTVFIGSDGNVVKKYIGPMSANTLRGYIETTIGG